MEINFGTILATAAITIMGAGLSSYIGVKVALAEMRKDIQNLTKADEFLAKRVERLEDKYFRRE